MSSEESTIDFWRRNAWRLRDENRALTKENFVLRSALEEIRMIGLESNNCTSGNLKTADNFLLIVTSIAMNALGGR